MGAASLSSAARRLVRRPSLASSGPRVLRVLSPSYCLTLSQEQWLHCARAQSSAFMAPSLSAFAAPFLGVLVAKMLVSRHGSINLST